MNIKQAIEEIINKPNNLKRVNGTYISQNNMFCFIETLENLEIDKGFLITPYLLSDMDGLYELYDYELDVIVGEKISNYMESNNRDEVIRQIFVINEDTAFLKKEMTKYFLTMEKLSFLDIKKVYPEFNNSQLVYQFFEE